MPLSIAALVFGLWGAATLYLFACRTLDKSRLSEKDQALAHALKAVRDMAAEKRTAENNLADARRYFEEQLKRPAMAFFTDEQVATFAKSLAKMLFVESSKFAKGRTQ